MKSLFMILLAGYAVRSNENNYYVVELPDVPPTPTTRDNNVKPFHVYWNVPTMQCASKKIYFENLENYGIIQNVNDQFKGEKITILYDPGLFPALFKNESSGVIRFRNGGVPQEGNLTKHLEEFKKELDRSIPDTNFSGIGIIDFESWRPQFRQNFGVLHPYKDVSFEIERKRHWWWKEAWIKEEAKRRFEETARTFMQSTLSVAKRLRPKARWGFYGFPYCFNMASNNMVEYCADGVPEENDDISWLWSESTALYPSLYSSVKLSGSQLASLVRGRLLEAARCASATSHDVVILPYFWFRYRDAGFMTESDLSVALSTMYNSTAGGILIWGSSNDVNTVEKCTNLRHYVENFLGPAIAKYTKPAIADYEEDEYNTTIIPTTHTESSTSNLVSNVDIVLEPEFHWISPDNYTQDLKNDVDKQTKRNISQNNTTDDNFTKLQDNNSVLIDLALNRVDNATTTTDNPKTKYNKINDLQKELIVSTSAVNFETSTYTSQFTNSVVTNNYTNTKLELQIQEISGSSETPIFDATTTENTLYETKETCLTNTDLEIKTKTINSENVFMTTPKINTDTTTDYDYYAALDEDDNENEFYNSDAFSIIYNKNTTITNDDSSSNTDATNSDFTKSVKKVRTQESLVTTDIETSTEKALSLCLMLFCFTTDKTDIIEVPSTEFIDTESTFINDTISKEATNEKDYITESITISTDTTEYVALETSTNNNDQNNLRKSKDYESNSYILTTTPTNIKVPLVNNLPNEIRSMGFDTKSLETSKTTGYNATKGTTTLLDSDTSKTTESNATEWIPTSLDTKTSKTTESNATEWTPTLSDLETTQNTRSNDPESPKIGVSEATEVSTLVPSTKQVVVN